MAAGNDDPSEMYRYALEAITEAVIITTAGLNPPGPAIIYANPAFEVMTGYPLAEVIGRTPRILHGPATDRMVMDRLRDDLENGRSFQGEAINYRKDSSPYVVEWTVSGIRNSDGVLTHWIGLQRDVTEHRASGDRQRALYAELMGRLNQTQATIRNAVDRTRKTLPPQTPE